MSFKAENSAKYALSSGLKNWKWAVFSFLAFFLFLSLFINAYLQRQNFIFHVKKNLEYTFNSLVASHWDIAYDHIQFNPFPLFPLVEIDNLQVYDKTNKNAWVCEKFYFDNSVLSPQKIKIYFDGKQFVKTTQSSHKLSIPQYEMFLTLNNQAPQSLFINLHHMALEGWADVENLALNIIWNNENNSTFMQKNINFNAKLDIQNIKLNGLLDYPLGQIIKNFSMEADMIGKPKGNNSFQASLREWLAQNGYFRINNITLNWRPLLLVGKGDFYLNENFAPILTLNTTSKALLNLLDEMEQKNWLDSKGVFVARVLLNNKAYKIADDKYLTVSTPISIRDDAILVEKIAIKKFD